MNVNAANRIPYDNIIDADGHILEPPDVWEKYIEPRFRERALRIRVGGDGREYLELDGRPSKFFNIKALALIVEYGGNDKFFWASDFPHFDHPANYIQALGHLVAPLRVRRDPNRGCCQTVADQPSHVFQLLPQQRLDPSPDR